MTNGLRLNFIAMLVMVAALGIALRLYGVGLQPLTSDDVAVAVSAKNYMETGHLGPTMWNHPNLRNVLVYASMHVFGGGVAGLKLWSLSFGSLTVLLTGLVAWELTGSKRAGVLAALFLAVDSLHVDFSRQAVHEVYMAFFSMAGIYCALRFRKRENVSFLLLAGLSFGLGMASKWYVIFPLVVTFVFILYSHLARSDISPRERIAGLCLCSSTLLALPLAVYLLTFLPWFLRGYGLADWVTLQKAMFIETRHHAGYNPYGYEVDIKPVLWFLKPVAFADFAMGDAAPVVLLGISNPLLWLPTLPAMAWLLRRAMAGRDAVQGYLIALFATSYLPLAISRRPIWAHTSFVVISFAFIATALLLSVLWDKSPGMKRSVKAYIFLALLVSIPLYLLSTGKVREGSPLHPVLELYRPSNER